MRTRRQPFTALLAVLLLALVASACGSDAKKATTTTAGTSTSAGGGAALPAAQLAIVAYSTPQAAYEKLIKAFQATPQGKNITFTQSYGASGDQSRAVAGGQTADIVEFSLETDMTRLVKSKLVAADWNASQYKGFVTDSVVVLATRKGNPKHITTWDDLIKPGIQIITPNPSTSGSARWNVLAAYGAASNVGKDTAKGNAYLQKFFKNVVVQDDSGRKALQTFVGGKGDVLISYQNEAIFAQQKGQAIDYTIPTDTIKIENPVAVTSTTKYPKQAKAFYDFLYSAAGQRIFADNGYTPVVAGVAKPGEFKQPSGLFTVDDLGGWTSVTNTFFDPTNGIVTKIEQGLGVPTTK
jgi:sulfate/thiosulfate-binding protein